MQNEPEGKDGLWKYLSFRRCEVNLCYFYPLTVIPMSCTFLNLSISRENLRFHNVT